jgi:hypothetical protein
VRRSSCADEHKLLVVETVERHEVFFLKRALEVAGQLASRYSGLSNHGEKNGLKSFSPAKAPSHISLKSLKPFAVLSMNTSVSSSFGIHWRRPFRVSEALPEGQNANSDKCMSESISPRPTPSPPAVATTKRSVELEN